MKKFKYLILTLVSALCLCTAFSGCSDVNASYVENSFTITHTYYYINIEKLDVDYEFKIDVKKAGRYKIDYVIYQGYSENNVLSQKDVSDTISSNGGEYTLSSFVTLETSYSTRNVYIKDITITQIGDETGYNAYAIGFGVTGAVILGGLIALFVCDKKGLLKKKDK